MAGRGDFGSSKNQKKKSKDQLLKEAGRRSFSSSTYVVPTPSVIGRQKKVE